MKQCVECSPLKVANDPMAEISANDLSHRIANPDGYQPAKGHQQYQLSRFAWLRDALWFYDGPGVMMKSSCHPLQIPQNGGSTKFETAPAHRRHLVQQSG